MSDQQPRGLDTKGKNVELWLVKLQLNVVKQVVPIDLM